MHTVKEVFRNFVGTWIIKRVLGNYGRAEGVAKFTVSDTICSGGDSADPLALHYREDVQVSYTDVQQGVSGTAYQEYVYLYDKERDKIIKRFTDGRNFYEIKLDFEKMEGEGEHLCDKDFYRAKYHFTDCDHFTLAYDVKGPQKDYVIQTHFERDVKGAEETSKS